MTNLSRTETRHRALTELNNDDRRVYLACVNVKRAVWKPRRADATGQFDNFTAAEARAVNDLLAAEYAWTPNWQGDMDVYRDVAITSAGWTRLQRWNADYGPVSV